MKSVALLRGINVGGKNKVSMQDLKIAFEGIGFTNVITYINSGNVIFDSDEKDTSKLIKICEEVIASQFGFHIVCSVIAAQELIDTIARAPSWWGGQDDSKHNVIFVIPPYDAYKVMEEVGEAKPEYEKIVAVGHMIFWTAPLKTFGRTRYSKIVGTKTYQSVTIRNANTVKKLVYLCK